MALTPEELAAARQIGALLFGSPLHRGLDFASAIGKVARNGGRAFEPSPMPESPVGAIDAANESARLRAQAMIDAEREAEPVDFLVELGEALHNYGFDTPDNTAALVRQTPEEHEAALMAFMGDPRYANDPVRAARLGIRKEQDLPHWWNDRDPRKPITPTSSCVKSVRQGPNGDIYVRFRSNPGKEYQYEGSADPVEASRILAQLVSSDSIGRDVNSWTGHWGKNHTYLPKG